MSQQLDKEKTSSNRGELARFRRVMSEEGIVDMRFVFCAVSLLALKESTPVYQRMTEVAKESCSKKGELGRFRRGLDGTVDSGSHTFEADPAQKAMAMRPKVNARNLAYVVLFWLSTVASLVLASDEPQLTVIISFHVTMCILNLLVRRASQRTIPRLGWDDMAAEGTDAVALQCAERFLHIAGAAEPLRRRSDDDRLQQLETQGLFLQTAESHGANNCLIDSLLLGLTAANLTPNATKYSMAERKRMCARCRKHLRRQYGTPVGTYLDGHADAPHILDFFLRQEWRQDVSVRVHFYDCLDAGQVLENQEELAFVDYTVGPSVSSDPLPVPKRRRGPGQTTEEAAHHATAFQHCPGDIPSAYVAALQHVEEQAVPAVGWSVDRRTLRRLRQARQEDHCVALICSCCAAVLPSGPRSDIGYLSIDDIFSGLTTKSFQENWDLKQYKTTYGLHASIRERLSGPEWQRRLPEHLFQGASILCCPEDHRCSSCLRDPRQTAGEPERSAGECPGVTQEPDPYQFCSACELPLRRSCWSRMRQKMYAGVPQALTNDNWYGYPVDLLYTHKVRWVEAAAACPVWTSMISFYLEADRGHVMEETLHRADQRLAIRGNVSAVSLPWEQIYGKFADMTPEHRLAILPHALPALKSMIHLTVRGMLHGEISDWVAGARVRPWVVVALLDHLVDLAHPMFEGYDGTPAELKALFRAKVNQQYGEDEFPAVTLAEVDKAPTHHNPSPPQTKHATPEPAGVADFNGEAFQGNVRPQVLSPDWSTDQSADLTAQEVTRLAVGTPQVTVQTGHEFWDQWQPKYLSWAFPFSLPAPVGGPDYPNKDRWRRSTDAAMLGPLAHLRSLTRRVESSIHNSWDLVSGLRRLTFKWHSVWNTPLWRKHKPKAELLETTPVHEWVQAAKALYHKLQKGTYLTAGNHIKPINYDARKLWFASNLTQPEIQLLRDIRQTQQLLPGTVEVRRRIGRFLFGARVQLGEPIFITVSPTTRRNAVCLKMSRYRANDPGAGHYCAKDDPKVWEDTAVTIPVPDYETRRCSAVRDPWCVDIAFQSMIRFVFAELLGVRMCFKCPQCTCRDMLEHPSHPMGGVLGLVLGFCGAIEYQQNSTPHFHANVYVASVWQHPLKVLAAKLQAKAVSLGEIFEYQQWLHNESHLNLEQHVALEPDLDAEWKQNFVGKQHDKLCLWPAFVAADTEPSPWTAPSSHSETLLRDATTYRTKYASAVQERLSHQQHHIHLWDPKHKCAVPLPGCRKKNAPNKCKHGFPKALCDTARVICRGNARQFRQSTAGRRNGLGCVLNPRDSPWLSGTMHAFSLMLLGNSHAGVNFRVPLLPETHDPACARGCLRHGTLRRLQRLMQHAARKSTQYFTGYLQKPQPIGKKELQQAAKHLSFLDVTPTKGAEAQQYRRVLQRICGDLEFRCSVRPLTEETMLAGFWDGEEVTSAECIRSFAVVPFVGSAWLAQVDRRTEVRAQVKQLQHRHAVLSTAEVYGWRGKDHRLYYLSPETQRDLVRLPVRVATTAAADHYLVRRPAPLVPYPTAAPLPKADMAKADQCRILNVYLRPWTAAPEDATWHAPHFAALDTPISDMQQQPGRRCRNKTHLGQRCHAAAWGDYIRNHIVSTHAKRLINNFLAAADCTPEEPEDNLECTAALPGHDVDISWVDLTTVQRLTAGLDPSQCLQAILERCIVEHQEERQNAPQRSEPFRAILHGVPGAGKSQTLKWLRVFFESICHWSHPQDFAFVAPQNTQAALIEGITLHSFADMRVKGAKQKPDPHASMQRFVKFQRLRWLIIDECSTAALEVLAALEKHLQDGVRPKNSWKCRKSGVARPFAGLNVLLAGDCWQFPAVKATSLFQNPFKSGQSLAVAALQKILWTHNQNNVQHLFELTQEHRCTDPWLSVILKAARRGAVDQELWSFLHGYPTVHPGSWHPATDTCGCKNPTCEGLPKIWTQEVLHGNDARTWAARLGDECNVCSAERRRRCIVAEASDFGPNPKDPKFLHAPFIHSFNAAKYVAALLRARWVAAEQNQLLLWAVAQDTPCSTPLQKPTRANFGVEKKTGCRGTINRQLTGGIMGLLPLLPNMPVRITQTLPELKPFGLFKNTRGQLYNWTLHPEDAAAIQTCTDSDWVLRHLPTCIFVAIPGATWQHRPGLPAGVACIRPGVQHWQLEAHGQATVARKGFPIACNQGLLPIREFARNNTWDPEGWYAIV
ncbi:unnamed protein product, partial [Durusdinium trenchii]